MKFSLKVGTAGWSIPRTQAAAFPEAGSHLKRYSKVLNGVEINSSFYREHQEKTYERWAREAPPKFRFSVKLSRTFTHDQRLIVDTKELREGIAPLLKLGKKLSVLLIQLPPSLEFQEKVARTFFRKLRKVYNRSIAFEPRHPSWSMNKAIQLLEDFSVSQVIADPEKVPLSEAGSLRAHVAGKFVYFRLHGSPVIYQSKYSKEWMTRLKEQIKQYTKDGLEVWCIFDNTTYGYATENARDLVQSLLLNG